MPEILYVPNRERVVTTNAWAFMHWLRTVHGVALADWAALQRFSVERQGEFRAAVAGFARLPEGVVRLGRCTGPQEALVCRAADGSRSALSRDQVQSAPLPLAPSREGRGRTSLVERPWPWESLIRPLAELLLHADLRPDDRLVVAGPSWPWLAALLEGTTVILADATAAKLLAVAGDERASVLVAPASALAEAAFQRPRHRPDLGGLRTIIATDGPLSPEGRRRIYTWVKSDLMLLARTGDTLWGNPLEPVLARPAATPALLTPPASDPATP